MQFLKIENRVKQAPSVELMRMLGASSSRGDDTKIGQFGSGFPYSLAVLARADLLDSMKVALGTDVYTFNTKAHAVRDANGYDAVKREIRMKKQNGGSWNLNISTDFGAIDWTDTTLAVREFISNALDGAQEYDGTYKTVRVELVSEVETRAKAGYVRVYIQVTPEIEQYVKNIDTYFPALNPTWDNKVRVFRNTTNGPALIYRKGVLVGKDDMTTHSLFNYNIPNVEIDESRNVKTHAARASAARALSASSPEFLAEFLTATNRGFNGFESTFDTYWLNPHNLGDSQEKSRQLANWKQAIDQSIGDAVIVYDDTTQRIVGNKGLRTVRPSSTAFGGMLGALGAKTADKILNRNELEGREIIDATTTVKITLDKVWSLIDMYGMTAGKEKPSVKGFRQTGAAEGNKLGYYRFGEDTIYILSDISRDPGTMLFQTVLEETAHYITQEADGSRGFQEFAFKIASEAMNKK